VNTRFLLAAGRLLNLLLWPFLILMLPFILLLVPGARPHIRERFGLGGGGSDLNNEKTLFHLASLGEANAATPLIRTLSEEGHSLILTTTSESGRGALLKAFPKMPVSLLPFDLPGLWDPFWKSRRISRVIIFETEIWPMMLLTAYSRHIPVMVVNGRLSPKGFRSMKRWRFFLSPLFLGLSRVLAGSPSDRDRYLEMGVREEILSVTGNLKWDMPRPESTPGISLLGNDLSGWLERFEEGFRNFSTPDHEELNNPEFRIQTEYLRVVLGSAHPGETQRILEALLSQPQLSSRIHLIIAPRHLQKWPEFDREGGPVSRVNLQFRSRSGENPVLSFKKAPIVSILDTHGELRALYPLSHLAITGGTFDPIGGHSPVEAASCSIPQVAGPFTEHVSSLVWSLQIGGGLFQVKNVEELLAKIQFFLDHPGDREKAAEMAHAVFLSEQGALARTTAEVNRFLHLGDGKGLVGK
jgi:3-deoxy-D-manno-octulosonic-acid transferase